MDEEKIKIKMDDGVARFFTRFGGIFFICCLFPQCPFRGRLFVCCCGRCSCVHLRGEPVSSYFSVACYSIVSY